MNTSTEWTDLHAGVVDGEINIHGQSRYPDAKLLSALVNRPFLIVGVMYASVEGFHQGIKFPPGDRRRKRAFVSSWGYAKSFSRQAEEKYVWWQDRQILWGSTEHKELIKMAFRESFLQNQDRLDALLRTDKLTIRHYTEDGDRLNTPFSTQEFCEVLTNLREAFQLER